MWIKQRLDCVMILAGLVMAAGVASASVSPAQRQRAIAAYDKAQQMHTTLEAHPESKRKKEDYKKVIDAYMEVYRQTPSYAKAPAALTAVAELYREMGRAFSSDAYFLEAIKSYRFLMTQYPQNRISREALFTIGEVYRQDLEDPDEARKSFQEFIAMYPKADKADEAKENLRQLDRSVAEKTKPPALPPPAEKIPQEATGPGLREVSAVRRWVGPNYMRIVVGINGEVKFDSVRLANPDRIVLDLQSAHLSAELKGKTFPVEDGFLRQIRVAQFSPDVARVVLDVEKIEKYSIFSLPNPFRLVIDVQGGGEPQMARTIKPPSPLATGSRKADKVGATASTTPAPGPQPDTAVKNQPAASARVQPAMASPAVEQENESASVTSPLGRNTVKSEKTETVAEAVPPAIQAAAPTEAGARTLTRALGLKIGRIVIDPGHGGHDTGTLGPTGLEEKEVVLDVGLKLRKLLERNTGCEVVMTRSDDTFIPLEERTAIANEKGADLFISIHANASPDQSARGIETYYLNFTSSPDALEVAARENASSQEAVHQLQDLIKKIAMTEKIEESQDFARQVQREVYTRVTKVSGAQRDRGIKKAPFVVLIGANMPSVLAEISFLTNPRDEHLLRRSDYREKIAYALYEGVLGYVNNLGGIRTAQRLASDQTSAAARPEF